LVIRNRKSKHEKTMIKQKTSYRPQNIARKIKDWATPTPLKKQRSWTQVLLKCRKYIRFLKLIWFKKGNFFILKF